MSTVDDLKLEGAEQVVSGELFKWDKAGKSLAGIYVNYEERPDTGKGPGHIYEFLTKDGIVPFFAPSILHKKLRNIAAGSVVVVKYTEESKTKTGNTLKLFEVTHAPDTEANRKKLGLPVEEDDRDF